MCCMVDKWILLEGPCKKDVIKKNRKAKDDKTNGKNERINSKDCSAAVRVDGASSRRSAVYTTRRAARVCSSAKHHQKASG